jgi:hypothetical protein
MLTDAWVGLNGGKIEENEKYYQNRQTNIHGSNLLLNNHMQIRCPLLKLITY